MKKEKKIKQEHYDKRFIWIEKLFVVLTIAIIVAGIICELIAQMGHSKWIIPDLSNIAMNVLQIMAGVSTLTVALLALISGMIGDEAYGISIPNYYMRIKPQVLKQHIVIIMSISLVFLSVVFLLFEYYNIVFALFFCEWVLIVISIIEIFLVFKGKRYCKKEIRCYILRVIEEKSHKADRYNVITSFFDHCKSVNINEDWDDNEEILWFVLNSLLKENSEESIKLLNTKMPDLIGAQLKHSESYIKIRGLRILQTTYEKIWSFILDNKTDLHANRRPIIIECLYEELLYTLNHLELSYIEENYYFDYFYEAVSLVSSWYLYKNETQLKTIYRNIEELYRSFGRLLKNKKESLSGTIMNYNHNYWGRLLIDPSIRSYNVPTEIQSMYLLHRCKSYFGYTVSLLNGGHKELFEEYYFERNGFSFINERYKILYRLAVACYLYYLYEESDFYVSSEIKECAGSILDTNQFKSRFTELITQINLNSEAVFYQNELETSLKEMLKPYELFNNGRFKTIIMDRVVGVFCIFIRSYISDYNSKPALFINEISYEQLRDELLFYFDADRRNITRNSFKALYGLMINKYNQIDPEKKADSLFLRCEKTLIEKFKEEKKTIAHNTHDKFVEKNSDNSLVEELQNEVMSYLTERFDYLIDCSISDELMLNLRLVVISSNTDDIMSSVFINSIYSILDGSFINALADNLYNKKMLSIYDRTKYDDISFLNTLKDKKLDLLIGSEYALSSMDYTNYTTFQDHYKNNCDWDYISYCALAIAVRKNELAIDIRNVEVIIHNASLENFDVDYNEESGLYRISLMNSIAGLFTKEDAKDYIRNQKKLVEINVDVAVKATTKESLGYLIKR